MARLILSDLVILYAASPFGQYLQLCDDLQKQSPHTRLLVIGNDSSPITVLSFLSHGATGYIVETTPAEQLANDIYRVGLGEPVVRGMTAGISVSETTSSGLIRSTNPTHVDLSNSELTVLCLLAQGKANKEIARTLSISEATVKWHLGRIYSKLGVAGRSEAIIVALNMGRSRSA